MYLRCVKDAFRTKFKLTLMRSYLNINMDLAKDLIVQQCLISMIENEKVWIIVECLVPY